MVERETLHPKRKTCRKGQFIPKRRRFTQERRYLNQERRRFTPEIIRIAPERIFFIVRIIPGFVPVISVSRKLFTIHIL